MAKLPWYVSSLLESLPAKQTLCVLCCKLEMRRCGEEVLTYAFIFINQFNVLLRFRNIISKDTMLKLYKAFILPHFYYCSSAVSYTHLTLPTIYSV